MKTLTAAFAFVSVWTAVAQVQSQTPGTEIAKGTNVLFGRVVDRGTDAPVAGAIVTVTGLVDTSGSSGRATVPPSPGLPGASVPRSVMANGDGYFLFPALPAGRYAVSAAAFGYAYDAYAFHVVELSKSDTAAATLVRLWKHAAISGTVFDDQGEPFAGAPVTALRRVTIGGTSVLRRAAGEVLTDDRGMYRIAELSPGSYLVGVLSAPTTLPASLAAELDATAPNQSAASALRSELIPSGAMLANGDGLRSGNFVLQRPGPMSLVAPDGRMLSYATTFSPGTPMTAEATVVTLGSGEQRTGVDVPLRLSPTVRVSGVVTGPGGPMRNIGVRLVPPNAADVTDVGPAGVATAFSDAGGAFTFLAVTPGPYTLKASLVTLQTSDPNTADISLWAAQPLTVGDSDLTDLAVVMRAGIRVSGRIEFTGPTGSAAPNPQNGAVGLRPIGAQIWRTGRGRVAANGTFSTAGAPPGRYVLIALGSPGWTLQTVSRDGRPVADDVIIELDATDVSGLVLTFSNKASRVSGSVVHATTGAADAQTDVIVFPADTTLWREGIFNDRRVRLMPATSIAAFEFSGLPPGEYYITAVNARLTSDWQDPLFLGRLIAGATKFTLGEGEDKTVPLRTFTLRDR